jgi:hypothetical protein
MTPDELRSWHRECDEDYARGLLEEVLAEIATTPQDVQQVLRRLLYHHLQTDFSADVDIVDDPQGSIELFHRYADPEFPPLA